MSNSRKKMPGDCAIGMNAGITRRDFLGTTLLASGAGLLKGVTPAEILSVKRVSATGNEKEDWSGYGGVGEYSASNENTYAVMEAGHKMRDGAFDPLPPDTVETGEMYDCVVIGGGLSGIAAALFFTRQTGTKQTGQAGSGKPCLILENYPIFGGEAKQNKFEVDGKRIVGHQGSAI